MPFKQVNPGEELKEICNKDKEFTEYVNEFNLEHEHNEEIIRRLDSDTGKRYTSEDVIKKKN